MKEIVLGNKIKLTVFVPCLACFSILLFLRDYVEITIPAVLFLGLTFLVASFAEKKEVLAFCFCCIPILNAFQSKYALLICMVLYVIRFERIKTIPLHILPISFLVAWEILHGFTSNLSFVEVLRLFTELLFCCFIMCISPSAIDFNKIVRSMAVMAVSACSIILLSQLKQYNYQIDMLFSGVFRLGYGVDETKMSVGFNPNYLAYICLCCIEGLAFIIYKKQNNICDVICLILLGIFGLLTMSKKFIICAMIFLMFFMLSHKSKVKTFLILVVVILVVMFIFQNIFPTAYKALLMRFEEGDMSTGRNDIFEYFNNQLFMDMGLLFFGVGLQGYERKLLTQYKSSIPHNGFQELLVMWGIPGFLMFVLFLIFVIDHARKKNESIQFINYAPFIIMILNVLVSQMVSSSVVNMLLAFVYVCLSSNLNEADKTIKI